MANPHHDEHPDYMLQELEEAHLFFTVKGKTDQEVAALLQSLWDFNHNKVIVARDHQHIEEIEAQLEICKQAEQDAERQHLLREQEEEQTSKRSARSIRTNLLPFLTDPSHPQVFFYPCSMPSTNSAKMNMFRFIFSPSRVFVKQKMMSPEMKTSSPLFRQTWAPPFSLQPLQRPKNKRSGMNTYYGRSSARPITTWSGR